MSVEILTSLLFASMFLLLATGLHISFAIGAVAAIFAIALWGSSRLSILASAGFSSLSDVNLAAVPLFVFLGWMFRYSGVGEELLNTVEVWLGNIPGGVAVGCLIISILFGAIMGDLAAVIFMLGAIALPEMLKRGYDKYLVLGTITAGGLLGLIIPPSIEIIIYSSVVGASVGKMYLGCLGPGLLMGFLYILYVIVRCRLNPKLAPALPPEKRASWRVRFAALRAAVLPLILVFFIMGGIYGGVMSPLEAAAFGAFGAVVIAAIKGRLTYQLLKESVYTTLQLAGLLAWLLIAVGCFTSVYAGIGAPELAIKVAHSMPGGGGPLMAVMQICLLGFGMIMDDIAIITIFGPIFVDVIKVLGWDTLWYGVVFLVNMNIAFLTPPYGFALFFMKAAAPKEYGITFVDIYRAVIPFVGLAVLALLLTIAFPPIATWLPNLLIGGG